MGLFEGCTGEHGPKPAGVHELEPFERTHMAGVAFEPWRLAGPGGFRSKSISDGGGGEGTRPPCPAPGQPATRCSSGGEKPDPGRPASSH